MTVSVDTPGVDDPGPGRRIGIDVGTVRIGVASSDRGATLATPVTTVRRVTGLNDPDGADIEQLVDLIAEYDAVEVIVGLPRDLKGNGSASVTQARFIAGRLSRRLAHKRPIIPVRLADERLTTVAATHALRASGVTSRKGRAVIDQAAAVEILQTWLDGRAHRLSRPNGVDQKRGPTPGPHLLAAAARPGATRQTPPASPSTPVTPARADDEENTL
ncbi:Holliday junction resolvase RuvX [Corynebacterium uberis]|uniref:Holliday junction resolvase RuvX n=1 Tax=Corynebacterium TaxID=1716 RepID=UPI00288BE289|nr:Holliday junction resolvase RuvX [uncultured Corynebacterium sp.]